MTAANPTDAQFAAYRAMYDHFNAALFGGKLRPVLLNFSRHSGALGFFAPDRWGRSTDSDQLMHEISLNPEHLASRPPREVASTLVHEMVHAWQMQEGKPSRTGYHNTEWAGMMEAVGLMPSDTGAPGGARVGQSMTHYVVDGGPFDRAFKRMPARCALPWQGRPEGVKARPKPISKLKYSCDGCGANAWGKPGLNLVCGDCTLPMESDGG